jgi:hypothetical protein
MTKVVCSGVTFEVSPANGLNGIVPQAISYRWNEPLVSTPSLTGGQSATNQPYISGKLTRHLRGCCLYINGNGESGRLCE